MQRIGEWIFVGFARPFPRDETRGLGFRVSRRTLHIRPDLFEKLPQSGLRFVHGDKGVFQKRDLYR